MTNLTARLTGVVCLATAGASTLLHRAIVVAAQGRPGTAGGVRGWAAYICARQFGRPAADELSRLFDSQETVTQLLVDGGGCEVDGDRVLVSAVN